MTSAQDAETPRHPIRVVSRRTGILPDVLRAWERRYEVVLPQREPTKRRLYSDEDIEKLRLLKLVVDAGRRISDVAGLSVDKLRDLSEEDRPSGRPARADRRALSERDLLPEALRAVEALDAPRFAALLEHAGTALSRPQLRNDFIVPLMQAIGSRWASGSLRISQEHLATSTVRSFLGNLLRSTGDAPRGAPVLLTATLTGEAHEIGALLAATVAADMGWRVLYMGANLPVEEIAAAALTAGARAVALSLLYPTGSPNMAQDIRRLRRALPPPIRLLVGGAAAVSYAAVLQEVEAVRVDTLDDFQEWLVTGSRP